MADRCIVTHRKRWKTKHTIYVEHHVPHRWTDRLMETEPNLPPSSQRVIVSLWWREEGTADWSVPVSEGAKEVRLHNSHEQRVTDCSLDSFGPKKMMIHLILDRFNTKHKFNSHSFV